MRLLICTQVVDKEHAVLGFFHRWIEEMATKYEYIEVICLYRGVGDLPENVSVYSLGKERNRIEHSRFSRRICYVIRFLWLVWRLRNAHDAVFVHMNQEYILLAGWFWRFTHKRVYMWRNHYAGSWLTDIAASFCSKVFCTSRYSFTAKYRKTVLMPVGVDTDRFHHDQKTQQKERSILFLSRMAPSKDPLLVLEAMRELSDKGTSFTATFVGSPVPEDEAYYRSLIGRAEHYGLSSRVSFLPSVPNDKTPNLYQSHKVFVNCSRSGMLDKTIFEAMACGTLVLVRNDDLKSELDPRSQIHTEEPMEVADRIVELFQLSDAERNTLIVTQASLAERHSLDSLTERLCEEMAI